MRYKSAQQILSEIGEDKQATTKVRLAATRILALHVGQGKELPALRGYASGSPENLLLRLASDSSVPAKDRFRAIKQLLALYHKGDPVKNLTVPEPVSTVASDADSIWVEVG